MLSIDTNLLLPAIESANPEHEPAAAFLNSLESRDDVAISEFVLRKLTMYSATLRCWRDRLERRQRSMCAKPFVSIPAGN